MLQRRFGEETFAHDLRRGKIQPRQKIQLTVAHLDAELLFQSENNVDEVERVGAKIVDQPAFQNDIRRLDRQAIGDQRPHLLEDFCLLHGHSIHVTTFPDGFLSGAGGSSAAKPTAINAATSKDG